MDMQIFETLVRKMPATVALHRILDRLIPAERLNDLFKQTAQSQYERKLVFSHLVDLCIDVVLGEQPSVHAAFRKHAPRLNVSVKSVYNKLNNMDMAVTAAIVRESAQKAQQLIQELQTAEPSWLPGYRIRILDGNALCATEHRIEELRTVWDAPLPGKVLAVLEQTTRLITDIFLTPDGHAQERTLLPEIIECVQPNDLWIADANFCTHRFLHRIDDRKAFFAIRLHGTIHGRDLGEWSAAEVGETGTISEQSMSMEHEGVLKTFRRIRVDLTQPTRNKQTQLDIVTNLPACVPMAEVAELYRKRWTIETLFWEMSETLECEKVSLCQPNAFVFVFCMGLIASNAIQVFKAGLRATHGMDVWLHLSLYYLMWDIHQSSATVRELLGEVEEPRDSDDATWAAELLRILKHLNLAQYRKTKSRARQPPKKPVQKSKYSNGQHVSTHKILEKRKKSE